MKPLWRNDLEAGSASDNSQVSEGGARTGDEIRQYLGVLRRNLAVLFAIVLLAIVAALFLSRSLVPQYSATSVLMLDTRETNVVDVQNVLSGLSNDYGVIAGELHLLQSYRLLERVVLRLKLHLDEEFVAPAEGTEEVALEETRGIGAAIGGVIGGLRAMLGLEPPAELPSIDPDPAAPIVAAVTSLQSRLVASTTGDYAPIMSVTVSSADPDKAILLANAVAEVYIGDQLESKFAATQRASTWLSERVADLKQRLQDSEAEVAAFRSRMAAEHGQTPELGVQQMSELSNQLIQARAARAQAEADLEQRLQMLAALSEGADGQQVVGSVEELRRERAELVAAEDALREQPGQNASELASIRERRAQLDRAIAARTRATVDEVRLNREIANARGALKIAQAREAALQQSLDELEGGVSDQSSEAVKLRELEREAETNKLIYEDFLIRSKQLAHQADIQQADARVISPAEVASVTSTSRGTVLLRGALVGVLLGAALILLLEKLDNKFRSGNEVEEWLNTRLLTSIPRVGLRAQRRFVLEQARQNPVSAVSEAARSLRTALTFASIDTPPKVVMVTSALAEEGKSTTSLLLAYQTVRSGRSAIVVDCDLRRPTLHRVFNIRPEHDLLAVLSQSSTLEDALHVDAETGVHAIPLRRAVPQAADVLSSSRFRELVEELRARYDLVVLDVPPVLLVSDAGIVGGLVDATILAVRWGKTPRQIAQKALAQLHGYGIAVTGAVLTFVDRRAAAQYEAYKYGYGRYKNKYSE